MTFQKSKTTATAIQAAKIAVLLLAVSWLIGCSMIGRGLSELTYPNAENYTPGAADLTGTVERVEINWPVGAVTVKPHSADTVSFSEEYRRELKEEEKLHYWLDGTTLRIQFCRTGKWRLEELRKELTVLVPDTLSLAEVKINSVSADVSLESVAAETVKCNTVSGHMRLVDCAVTESLGTDTVSGEVEASFTQPLRTFGGNSTSGSVRLTAPGIEAFSFHSVSGSAHLTASSAAPKTLDIKTTSGAGELTLPRDADFALDYDSASGKLSTDLPHTRDGGRYLFGDGTGEYAFDSVSGDLRINAQ